MATSLAQDGGYGTAAVTFHNDTDGSVQRAVVSDALADLFAYAHRWGLAEQEETRVKRAPTLTFSSMLAAMVSCADPLCGWLRRHMDLRGVPSTRINKSRTFGDAATPEKLTTTFSFRQAFDQASKLNRGNLQAGLGVRHFMAAYAVVPRYHLKDFLRLRIDRRAWCLSLAEYLAAQIPEEQGLWMEYARLAPAVTAPGFESDAPDGRDLLNIEREVEAFSALIASRQAVTPLSIGVFGPWGSGKSFFMRRIRERVAAMAAMGRREGRASKYHGQTAQIEFNAWHYSEGNLIACLVDHIFRNLRFEATDEEETILRERSVQLLTQIEAAEQIMVARKDEVEKAESRVAQAKQQIELIDSQIQAKVTATTNELAGAQSKLQDAQEKLDDGVAQLKRELESAVADVPVRSVIELLEDKLLNDPALADAGKEIQSLVRDAKRASGRGRHVFWGLVVLAVAAIAAMAMQSEAWLRIASAAAALGSFAAMARTWLKKLHEIADSGERFQERQAQLAKTAAAEVTAAHAESLAKLRTVANERLTAVEALRKELAELQQAPAAARLELAALDEARADAVAQHVKAAVDVERQRQALDRLTAGKLLEELLNDYVSTQDYRKELTIFSRVRNQFERLSKLMTRAAAAYYDGDPRAEVPAVSRIVLYIDDLDRCPAEIVIEVLRVVHLLLAFPLFVCVVGVDPRWLTECLRRAPGLVKHPPQNGSEQTLELGVLAAPADYLEKIFQIPLWIRPIDVMQRPAVVRALLGEPQRSGTIRRDRQPMVVNEPVAPLNLPVDAGREDSGPMTERDAISSAELEYLDRLRELLDGNPRALKRFVNTYRLVKTALSDVEIQVFLKATVRGLSGQEITYMPYRICMVQLAILCTQRPRALEMVRYADEAPEGTPIEDWLRSLAQNKANEKFANCLRDALREGGNLQELDFSTFQLWLERTRRYSFYL